MRTSYIRTNIYVDQGTFKRLFELVNKNLSSLLDLRLRRLFNVSQYLKTLNKQNGQQVSFLMAAAIYGYDDIIRVLLKYDDTVGHVELKGRIILSDGTLIDGVTALYCACCHGHFTVVKTLIELGHAEKSTALTWAASRGHTSLLEYLISKDADVNYIGDNKGLISSRPVGLAVLAGHIDAVRILYHAGADMDIADIYGDTPLTIAVRKDYPLIIDFLLDQSINSIEDLELVACSSVEYHSSLERMHRALETLKIALQQRARLNLNKVCVEPVVGCDYQQECQTADELDSIKDNRERIYLETLLIRNRIALFLDDISLVKPLHYYGDVLVENEQFKTCLNLWIDMFYLYQRMHLTTILHRFVWLFCRMLTANKKIPVEWFLKVGRLVFEPSHLEEKRNSAINTILLVVIATKVL